MRGQFRIYYPDGSEQVIRNTIPDEGEESYLKMIFQGDNTIVAGGGNFYIGMCDQTPVEADTLADITTEPTVTNGYARQAITRDATGWPTIDSVGGIKRIISAAITFTPSGGDFSRSFSRLFLCNVASGSAGILLAFSGALDTAKLVTLAGGAISCRYELYFD